MKYKSNSFMRKELNDMDIDKEKNDDSEIKLQNEEKAEDVKETKEENKEEPKEEAKEEIKEESKDAEKDLDKENIISSSSDENGKTNNIVDEVDKILQEIRDNSSNNQSKTKNQTPPHKNEADNADEMVDISHALSAQTQGGKNVENKEGNNINAIKKNVYIPKTSVSDDKKPKKHTGLKVGLGLAGVFVLLCVAFYGTVKLEPTVVPVTASIDVPGKVTQQKEEEPVFLKGIKVAGVDIGGKTLNEAQALLSLRGGELVSNFDVKISYDGKDYNYNKSDFEYTYDINSSLNKAYEFNNMVLQRGSNDAVSNAPADDSSVVIDSEKQTVNFKLDDKVKESSVQKVAKRVAKEIDIACVEPHVSKYKPNEKDESKRYTYEEGKNGLSVDQDKLITQIMDAYNSGDRTVELTAETFESQPKHTMDEIKGKIVLISKFSTVSTNGYNANSNMATALGVMNGTIIEPGATYSFNDLTGNSNLESNGYLPAGVISNGEMTTGVGGGICQAATTIYNAGIMADMEIVQRAPHKWCSTYVYGGLDATIDWGVLDLKMKNRSEYQLFMKTWMDGVTLHCEIYGLPFKDFDEIRTESELDWASSSRYGYNSWRVYYKNGKKIKTEDLPYSEYDINGYGIRPADPGDVSTKINHNKKKSS